MTGKMLELKNLIKLNSEYNSIYKLYIRNKATEKQVAKMDKLNEIANSTEGMKIIFNLRLYHIAYALLKGRTYEQIENTVKLNNQLTADNWKRIQTIISEVMNG
jgi:hypothetical protein